jgi:hypothetical protein
MSNDVTINIKANTAQAQSALGSLNKSWIGLNSALDLGQKAARMLGEAYDFLAGDTMAYAAQVRQMMRVSGQGAEMTSRMIQLTDDFALSEASLTAAMRGASMKGIAFTVENLAKLSDEYLRLAPGTERNTMLIQSFGRAGLEMAKVMEKGGAAIRAQGAAQADNLIMTQANLDKAEELRIAEDNLSDAFMGIKYTLGNQVIPVLVTAANAFQLLLTWHDKVMASLKEASQVNIKTSKTYADYVAGAKSQAQAAGLIVRENKGVIQVYQLMNNGQLKLVQGFRIVSKAEYDASRAGADAGFILNALTGSLKDVAGAAPDAAGGLDDVGQAAVDNYPNIYDLKGAWVDYAGAVEAAKRANRTFSENLGSDLQSALETAGVEGDKLNKALGVLDKQLGINILPTQELKDAQQKLASEYAKTGDLEAFARGIGELDAKFRPLQKDIIDTRVAVQDLKAALDLITSKNYTIYVTMMQDRGITQFGPSALPKIPNPPSSYSPAYPGIPGGANGMQWDVPPGFANDRALYRASSGEHVSITPAGTTNNMGGITIIVNGAGTPTATANAIAYKLASYGKQYQGA